MSTQDWIQDLLIGAQDLLLLGAVVAAIVLAFITRDDVREAREARYDQQRPALMPSARGFNLIAETLRGYNNQPYADLARDDIRAVLDNIGTGVALSVCGAIFGPRPDLPDHDEGHHSFRYEAPIKSGKQMDDFTERGGFKVFGDMEIVASNGKRYPLYAPPRPDPAALADGVTPYIIARLTVTYHDIFGRKHASIFDYTSNQHWRRVDAGFFPGILQDLEELERDHARRISPPAFLPAPKGPSPIPPQLQA